MGGQSPGAALDDAHECCLDGISMVPLEIVPEHQLLLIAQLHHTQYAAGLANYLPDTIFVLSCLTFTWLMDILNLMHQHLQHMPTPVIDISQAGTVDGDMSCIMGHTSRYYKALGDVRWVLGIRLYSLFRLWLH
jgi:hypothetical protein